MIVNTLVMIKLLWGLYISRMFQFLESGEQNDIIFTLRIIMVIYPDAARQAFDNSTMGQPKNKKVVFHQLCTQSAVGNERVKQEYYIILLKNTEYTN